MLARLNHLSRTVLMGAYMEEAKAAGNFLWEEGRSKISYRFVQRRRAAIFGQLEETMLLKRSA